MPPNRDPEEDQTRAGRGGIEPPPSHRWKPGQSGNPCGRPKGSISLMVRFERRLREAVLSGDRELADAVVEAMVRAVIRDPIKAWPILREFIQREDRLRR